MEFELIGNSRDYGDGDRTGFSLVEAGNDQLYADTGARDARISGYVSPLS